MKFALLKRSLEEKILPCYMIFGEDSFLVETSVDLIEKKLFGNLQKNNINKQVFSNDELNLVDFRKAVETLPFFAEKKLVVLKEYDNKTTGELIDYIKDYLTSPNESCVLVIILSDESLLKAQLKNLCEDIDCSRLEKPMLEKWIQNKLLNTKKITPDAMQTLINFTNGYLSRINLELDKLIAYSKDEITKKDVEELVLKDLEYSIFELSDCIIKKDYYMAQKIKQDLMKNTKTIGTTFSVLTNYFRRLFYSIVSDGTTEEIANLYGVKEYSIKIAKNQAKNFGVKKLKEIVELSSELDYKTKTGKMTIENATDYLLFKIME